MPMDRPPLPSPDIQVQQGAAPEPGPGAGIGMIAQRMKGEGAPPAGGSPNPFGAILAQVDAIKAVLKKVAEMNDQMAPFCDKASQILDDGVAAVTSAPSGSPEAGQPPPPPPGGPGMTPPLG